MRVFCACRKDLIMSDENAEVVETTPEDTATSTEAEPKEVDPKIEAEQSTEEPKEEPKKKPRRNRRTENQRIAQLTAQLRERERELEAIKQPPEKPADAPKRENYDDYEEYIEARAEYRAEQAATKRLEAADKAREEREREAQAIQQHQTFESAREDTLERGSEKYEDFEAVTQQEDLHITPVMGDALLSSERGEDIWYHLGKNPDVAEKIANMEPVQQILEMGRLEERLSAGKTASNAPPPTKPVSSRGPANNTLSDKMSTADWMRKRNEEARKSSY